MDLNKAVGAFIELRDLIAKKEKEHKAYIKKIKETQAKLQRYIDDQLTSLEVESIKTGHGTAFKTTKDSVTVANKAEFMEFVTKAVEERGVDGLYMLTVSANKNSVKDYMEEHEDELPPGIKYQQWQEISVRKN